MVMPCIASNAWRVFFKFFLFFFGTGWEKGWGWGVGVGWGGGGIKVHETLVFIIFEHTNSTMQQYPSWHSRHISDYF